MMPLEEAFRAMDPWHWMKGSGGYKTAWLDLEPALYNAGVYREALESELEVAVTNGFSQNPADYVAQRFGWWVHHFRTE